jgi:hypothetical protein
MGGHDWDGPKRSDWILADPKAMQWTCRNCRRLYVSTSRTDVPRPHVRLPSSIPGHGVVFWTCGEFLAQEVHDS